jgi:predicted RNA binding protein YcfA (HicA-like mRNA interferase family)
LRRWLRKHMPCHPANELKTGTLQSILRDLDLKM